MYLIFIALLFVLPLTLFGQTSVCADDETPENVILTICERTVGMAPRPQPKLYLRVLNDGGAEYEVNDGTKSKLFLREIFINGTELQDLARFGHEDDFQSARKEYPAINRGIDSSIKTTVTFRGLDGVKFITLNNYSPSDPDNYIHYPDALNRLMYLAEEVRLRAFGMKRVVPAITYCEALKNSRRYLGKRVSIYADLDYTGPRPYLTDECTATVTGAVLPHRIGVEYNELGKMYGSISGVIENARVKPFYGHARLLASGRMNDDGSGLDRYSFEIDEYLGFRPLVVPYQGLLEPGRTYSDTIRHPGGKAELSLSSPLRPIPHHTARIEWTNLTEFPRLLKPGLMGITFHVLTKTAKQVADARWKTTYICEVLKVE